MVVFSERHCDGGNQSAAHQTLGALLLAATNCCRLPHRYRLCVHLQCYAGRLACLHGSKSASTPAHTAPQRTSYLAIQVVIVIVSSCCCSCWGWLQRLMRDNATYKVHSTCN
jgi:hypothetical protein